MDPISQSIYLQTGENWQLGMEAKVLGAYNLDRASMRLPELRHFVLWSSQVTQAGNEGMLHFHSLGIQSFMSFGNISLPALSYQAH